MPRTQKANTPVVALIMGSKSDLDVVKGALTVLDKFEVPYTARVREMPSLILWAEMKSPVGRRLFSLSLFCLMANFL